jgi:hypothetical protein
MRMDPWFFMRDLWEYLNPETQVEGFDISGYLDNTNQLNFWMPDIVFFKTLLFCFCLYSSCSFLKS